MNKLYTKSLVHLKHVNSLWGRCYSSKRGEPVNLAYDTFQNIKVLEPGPPLIIIHGLFGSRRNWGSMAKAFAKSGRKVVTVDCRNHGGSPHVDSMDYHSMSADIALLMEKLAVEKACVLGHSMGGKVAMTLALTQPSLLDKLIIEDILPTCSEKSLSEFPAYVRAMQGVDFMDRDTTTLAEMRQSVDQQLKKVFQEVAVRSFILTNVESKEGGEFGWNINVDAIEKNFAALFGFPVFDVTYSGETLFVGGSLSQHFKEKDHPQIWQYFPTAQIKTVVQAGHWVHAEKPQHFLAIVNDFLTTTS